MNHPSKQNKVSVFLIRTLIFIIFWFIAIGAILYSMGYDLDWRRFKVEETGIIYLDSSVSRVSAQIDLDGITYNKEFPVTFNRIKPGNYPISISKAGYFQWQKNFTVSPSQVSAWKNIVLIKKNLQPVPASEIEKSQLLSSENLIEDKTIKFKENELYIDHLLVTRFSKNITQTKWYPDGEHIVYQIDNQINIIESDGFNDITLATLKTNDLAKFTFLNKGQSILYQDNREFFKIDLY